MLNSQFGVGRSLRNREIATRRSRILSLARCLVSPSRPRPAVAPNPRTVCNPGFRVHAPANAGRHRHPLLPQVAAQVSRFRLAGPGPGRRSASRVARPWLLRSRAKSPRHCKNGDGSIRRTISARNRPNAGASRNRQIHRARGRKLCVRSICSDRRSEHRSRFGAAF